MSQEPRLTLRVLAAVAGARDSRAIQILALDLHQPGTDGPLGWSAEDGAGGHVELGGAAAKC